MSKSIRKRLPTVTRKELTPDGTDNDFRTMIHNLLSVSHRLQANRNSHASMLGLSGVQYTLLTAIAHLQGEDGVSVKDIARHLHMSPSFVTMETAKMVAIRVIRKRQDDADRRRVQLMVSARGWNLLDKIVPVQQPVNDTLFDTLSKQDFAAFSRIIAVIADNSDRAKAVLDLLKHSRS
ncbi:MAG: MarR family winged helix-turn-helix transcriptional regulator [Nitrospiraceae bacterium]